MNAIFGVNALGGFGANNTMPWPRSAQDMRRFVSLTRNKTVVMGRGTWDSDMPKPLPNRRNCVLSNTLVDDRCEVFYSVNALLEQLPDPQSVWVIGGATVLWTLRSHITTVHLSVFPSTLKAEVTLNTSQYLEGFKCTEWQDCEDHQYYVYRR